MRVHLKWLLGLLFGLMLAANAEAEAKDYCTEQMADETIGALRAPVNYLFEHTVALDLGITNPMTNGHLASAIGEVDISAMRFLAANCPNETLDQRIEAAEEGIKLHRRVMSYHPPENFTTDRPIVDRLIADKEKYSEMLSDLPSLIANESCQVEMEKVGCNQTAQPQICFLQKMPSLSKSTACGRLMVERGYFQLFEGPGGTPPSPGKEAQQTGQEG